MTAFFPPSARAASRRLLGLLLCGCLLYAALPDKGFAARGVAGSTATSANEPAEELLKVVVLTRHGVRTPTQSRERLEQWTALPWPVWPQWTPPGLNDAAPDAPGRLTERGARLVAALWSHERERMNAAGLLRAQSCPDPASIFVYADLDERTRATAQALLEGLAPDCGLKYASAPDGVRHDPLFHPVRAGTAVLDAAAAARRIQRAEGDDLSDLARELRTPLRTLADIAGPLPPTFKQWTSLPAGATLADVPTRLDVADDGRALHVDGALGIGADMTEVLLLEYAQWPGKSAGWGRVDGKTLRGLLPLHVRVFNAINRDADVARAGGGSLLAAMTAALNGDHPDARVNAARLVVFVGHDTNIAQVGGLLHLDWNLPGYAPRQAPPAGALVLSLRRAGDREYVTAHFTAQSLETLHDADLRRQQVLSAEMPIPECPTAPETGPCDRQRFLDLTRALLSPAAQGATTAEKP